ncbi:MAG: glycosyltransferase [Methylophilaceae bacterium]|nr:glycosyltransferase [Methylophilaceae bacterium]
MQTLFAGFLAAFVVVMMIIRWCHVHIHLSADDHQGPQKFHQGQVPRIGGVGVTAGVFAALTWSAWRGLVGVEAVWLLLAAFPALAAGLIEDVTKRLGVEPRLLATLAAAGLGIGLLGAQLSRIGIPVVDAALVWAPASWLLTLVAVSGMVNAVNIIDGFNGLAAAVSMLMLMAFGYVAWSLGDVFIVQVCLGLIGALLGFFVWNYPRGLIFLGDGGAYLVGFILAEVAVLLVARHPALSPWFCFLVCAYPITETIFSIYRKRFMRGMSPGVPDGLHLHMLVYRRLIRWTGGHHASRRMARNSATSPYLWGLTSVSVVPAMLLWRSETALVVASVCFVMLYVWIYVRLIRFRAPRWLRRRIG